MMKKIDVREQLLPTSVRGPVLRLLAAIEVAETVQALRLAEQRAEGFVLGLDTSGGFAELVIETLYIGFEQAVADRLDVLRNTQ